LSDSDCKESYLRTNNAQSAFKLIKPIKKYQW